MIHSKQEMRSCIVLQSCDPGANLEVTISVQVTSYGSVGGGYYVRASEIDRITRGALEAAIDAIRPRDGLLHTDREDGTPRRSFSHSLGGVSGVDDVGDDAW